VAVVKADRFADERWRRGGEGLLGAETGVGKARVVRRSEVRCRERLADASRHRERGGKANGQRVRAVRGPDGLSRPAL